MALQKTINLENGTEVKDAYIKVTGITGNKSGMNFVASSYINKTHSECGCLQSLKDESFEFQPDLESKDNFLVQAYGVLKSSENYTDAIDV